MFFSQFNRKHIQLVGIVLQLLFIMAWLGNLSGTDAFLSVYALIGLAAVLCLLENYRANRFQWETSLAVCAAVFSVLTFLSNYELFCINWFPSNTSPLPSYLRNGLNSVCSLVGGFVVAYHIVLYAVSQYPKACRKPSTTDRLSSKQVFWIIFVLVVVVDSLYLFLDEFPGTIMQDPIAQIQQAYTGLYVNDHPVWHTWFLKVMLSVGFRLFGTANGAAAFLSFFQILVFAVCFAYAISTLYQSGIPKWCVLLIACIYVLSPYNIAYSITFIKDVYFGMALLLITASLYRIMNRVSDRVYPDAAVLCFACLLLCLSRTNGFAVCCVFFLFLIPALFKNNRAVVWLLIIAVLLGWFLTGPLLTMLQVESTDVVELFSIPLQQMARVISKGYPLTSEQTDLLSKIFDLEAIPDIYVEWVSDPIKVEVRSNDAAYLANHLSQYIKLWLDIGKEYPLTFFEAWVEQTKGYWNGGYDYFQYAEGIWENDFGFYKTGSGNVISLLFELYFAVTDHLILLQPFNSIGLQVWLVAFCCFMNIRKKRTEYLLSIPILIIVAGLLIGTPVYAEFRYAYPVFLTCPFILAITLYHSNKLSELSDLSE